MSTAAERCRHPRRGLGQTGRSQHGLVSSLYNPYAAVPSMQVGYALIVGTNIARHAPHLIARLAGGRPASLAGLASAWFARLLEGVEAAA